MDKLYRNAVCEAYENHCLDLCSAYVQANIDAFDVELSAECIEDIAQVYKKYRDPSNAP